METDVLIIGAGPAGLHAAYEMAANGVQTIIVDESFSPGGQLKQQTQYLNNLPRQFETQRGINLVETLTHRLHSLPVTMLYKHTMIGAYKDGSIGVSNGESTFPIKAKKVIVTTGAAEEASLFPGWTQPGVMTVGAAQILLNRERVLPGKNAVILGYNFFSLEVALQLKECGVNILGIVEKNNSLDSESWERLRSEIPLFLNSSITRAMGRGEVEKVFINHNGVEKEWETDLICIGNGLSPILEPFEILDCSFIYKEKLGGLLPRYDSNLRTENSSVYVAGNAAGITCMGGILLTAEIAAVDVLVCLGVLDGEEAAKKSTYLWKELLRIETQTDSEVFYARVASIQEFHDKNNIPLPTSFHAILEEC
ncbi:NAD(P)/FAD-dependent oxidoreductase [Halobacillus naozhouensis]|uniref:FAD-dependent oxidoreductase n=1 Tax=Halobacillus naozhouensis TaxID=554880 RepID=A0ABY8IY37_9BACI|nr:FAD-dependent oxidoreductase [Halobacillus naozhouensis]WFT74262.1 FAD-dependent oxidoreductase [Halobacillus naozhouensis]